VIDVSSASGRDPIEDFETIRRELDLFPVDDTATDAVPLARKRQIAAANKIDALDEPERLTRLTDHLRTLGIPLFPISAVTGEGVDSLLQAMWREVGAARDHEMTARRVPSGSGEPSIPCEPPDSRAAALREPTIPRGPTTSRQRTTRRKPTTSREPTVGHQRTTRRDSTTPQDPAATGQGTTRGESTTPRKQPSGRKQTGSREAGARREPTAGRRAR
jgi:hypothetical protein